MAHSLPIEVILKFNENTILDFFFSISQTSLCKFLLLHFYQKSAQRWSSDLYSSPSIVSPFGFSPVPMAFNVNYTLWVSKLISPALISPLTLRVISPTVYLAFPLVIYTANLKLNIQKFSKTEILILLIYMLFCCYPFQKMTLSWLLLLNSTIALM